MNEPPQITFQGLGFAPGDVVVVTGAASGIGRSTALLAARAGLRVAAWDLNPTGAGAVRDEIAAAGGTAAAITADVTDAGQVDAAWDATAELGPAVYLASNAGPTSRAPVTLGEGVAAGLVSMMSLT